MGKKKSSIHSSIDPSSSSFTVDDRPWSNGSPRMTQCDQARLSRRIGIVINQRDWRRRATSLTIPGRAVKARKTNVRRLWWSRIDPFPMHEIKTFHRRHQRRSGLSLAVGPGSWLGDLQCGPPARIHRVQRKNYDSLGERRNFVRWRGQGAGNQLRGRSVDFELVEM